MGGANLYCTSCQAIVQAAEKAVNCSAVCEHFKAPTNQICEYLVTSTGICDKIGHMPADQVCTKVGLCGSPCECGVCTEATAGPEGRCLGAPNDCGHSPKEAHAEMTFPRALMTVSAKSSFACLDGRCDAEHLGCCLTCF